MGKRQRQRQRHAQQETPPTPTASRWVRGVVRNNKVLSRIPNVISTLLFWVIGGCLVGAGVGWAGGGALLGALVGVPAGVTMWGVQHWRSRLGLVTSLIAAGVVWAVVMGLLGVLAGRGTDAAAWLFIGMMAPWLFWAVTVPVRVVLAGKGMVVVRWKRQKRARLWDESWVRDWTVWCTGAGFALGAIFAAAGWWMVAVGVAGIGPLAAAVRLARRDVREVTASGGRGRGKRKLGGGKLNGATSVKNGKKRQEADTGKKNGNKKSTTALVVRRH